MNRLQNSSTEQSQPEWILRSLVIKLSKNPFPEETVGARRDRGGGEQTQMEMGCAWNTASRVHFLIFITVLWARPNICVPQISCVETSSPVWCLRRWGLREVLGQEGGALHPTSFPYKGHPRELPCPSYHGRTVTMWGDGHIYRADGPLQTASRLSPDMEPTGTLTLNCQPQEPWDINFYGL